MILNVFSIVEIFIGLLSFGLMAWAGIYSFRLVLRYRKSVRPEDQTLIEDRSYLLLSATFVILIVRLINWPLFYLTLQSFIPQVNGAMCIFGVTQVEGHLTNFLEFTKPLEFFLIGGWLILHHLDRATQTGPLLERKLILLVFLSLLVMAESLGDVILFFTLSPSVLVSCCTTVTDILNRPTSTIPQSLLGPGYRSLLETLYFALTILLIGIYAFFAWVKKWDQGHKGEKTLLTIVALLSLANAVVFLLVQIESFAPRFMGLPFHHCLYCLWQYVPDSIILYLLFILGTMAPGWAWLLEMVGRKGEAMGLLTRYFRSLFAFAALTLSASLIMTIIHLVLSSGR
ncbi:MAG: hypothetical protein V2B13_18915 [Pseudomonadota bacterium]